MANRGIRVPIVADDAQFRAALKADAAATRVFSEQMTTAQVKVAAAQDRVTKANQRYGAGSAQAARATVQLRDAQTALAAEQTTLAQRLDTVSKSAVKLGSSWTRTVSAPLAAAGVIAVKSANNFDLLISRMVGLGGVSDKTAAKWRQFILELAPKVGKDPAELANALYQIASAGVKGHKALDVLTQSAKASAAGLGDTATVADALTSVLNAYAKTGLTATQATNELVSAVRDGKGEADQFAPVLGKVVAVASQLGVPFDQVAGALAQMTKLGVPADDAATQLSATFSELLKTTPAAQKALAEMGLSADGLRQELREKGLLATLETLRERTKGSSTAMAEAFPNVRALRGILQLVGNAASGTSKTFHDTADAAGSLDTAFGAASGTKAFRLQQDFAQLKVDAINLGEKLAPLGDEIVHGVTRLADAFDKLSPSEKTVLLKLAEAAAVGGPLLLFTGKVLSAAAAIGKVGKAFDVLKVASYLGNIAKIGAAWDGVTVSATAAAGAEAKAAAGGAGVGAAAGEGAAAGAGASVLSRAGGFAAGAAGLLGGVGASLGGMRQGQARVVNGRYQISIDGKHWADAGPAPSVAGSAVFGVQSPIAGAVSSFLGAGATDGSKNLSAGRKKLIDFAMGALGTPYLWGGNGPGGFDCSGLVQWAFANGLDVNLPRTTYGQVTVGKQVGLGSVKPGDVVFTDYGEDGRSGPGHEGLYIGGGMVLQAPHTGAKVSTIPLQQFIAGGAYQIRDLLAPTSPSSAGTGSDYDPKKLAAAAAKVKHYKIPTPLTDKIATAWAAYEKHTTKGNEQAYLDAVKEAEQLARTHGISTAAYIADISKAGKTMAAHVAAVHVAAAKKAIGEIEAKAAGPEQALKIAQAAGAPTAVVVADEKSLLAAYRQEAAQLKARMGASSGRAKSEYAAALQQIEGKVSDTRAAVIGSLQDLARAAQQRLASAASTLEQDVVGAFEQQTQDHITNVLGPRYQQNGLQTPAEQQLARMQAADQQKSLADALTQARKQLDLDRQTADVTQDQLDADQAAIDAAQRQIDESNVAAQATAERARADADYAAAVKTYTDQRTLEEKKLVASLDQWAAGVAAGTLSVGALSDVAAGFGVTLAGLTDPNTGVGYDFGTLSSAAQDAAAALANLTKAAGGSVSPRTSSGTSASVRVDSHGVAHFAGTTITAMAAGGIVRNPTVALIGEAGDEAVIPLDRLAAGEPRTLQIVLELDGQTLARAQAPYTDGVVRVKLS